MDIKLPLDIIEGVISGKKNKLQEYEKARINKLNIAGKQRYQISLYTQKQVFHTNVDTVEELEIIVNENLDNLFNNLEITTKDFIYSYRISASGKVLSNRRKNTRIVNVSDHNKKKKYIIEEGTVIPALVDLGVIKPNGDIIKSSYDKFRQINRFLEIIDDNIKDEKSLRIIDFGCGKSYLTFIIYYYLMFIRNIDCEIIGLDLKEDVINKCNELAIKYGYLKLKFYNKNIKDFEGEDFDMIITLHACDTATDYALFHAIRMECRYIFSVPCCQHEINNQLDTSNLHLMNKFGIVKERFSALLTDSIRANILQYFGYKTQILEFVDFDASPKNLLIRATYNGSNNPTAKQEVDSIIEQYNIKQTLHELCKQNDMWK